MTLQQLDPLYHFNTHYPDRLHLLDPAYVNNSLDKKTSSSRISRRKNNPRYKTQPITFDEIKEVEEPITPNDENRNNVNSFLNKLQETGGVAHENTIQANQRFESVRSEVIAGEVGSSGSTLWYDSPYPTKLSFLDVPEAHHHHHHHHLNKGQTTEKTKLKGRAARRRNNPRYKTQPITFDEIKEVEEPDNNEVENSESISVNSTKPSSDQQQTLNSAHDR